jgi:hypothetical protein
LKPPRFASFRTASLDAASLWWPAEATSIWIVFLGETRSGLTAARRRMDALPNYGLANTVTGFCTLLAGVTCLGLCRLVRRQPRHWVAVYWLVVVTGVFTVTLHGFGETASGYGPRWFWACLDTGSNIVVAWGLAWVALTDYWDEPQRRRGHIAVTVAMLLGVTWHFYDRLPSTERSYLVPLGDWGGFYAGESCLIALSFTTLFLFTARRHEIPERARPILVLVASIFLFGMGLATASSDRIVTPFFSVHALWHVVGAVGFVFLWAFNHVVCEERATGSIDAAAAAARTEATTPNPA